MTMSHKKAKKDRGEFVSIKCNTRRCGHSKNGMCVYSRFNFTTFREHLDGMGDPPHFFTLRIYRHCSWESPFWMQDSESHRFDKDRIYRLRDECSDAIEAAYVSFLLGKVVDVEE